MSWKRNGSFPLLPSGLEINYWLVSEDGRHIWITVRGEDSQATERVAEPIQRSLNPTPDQVADSGPDHTANEVRSGDA